MATADTPVPAQILDVFQCIERLHELGTASLRKLLTKGTLLAVPRLDKALPFRVSGLRHACAVVTNGALHCCHCTNQSSTLWCNGACSHGWMGIPETAQECALLPGQVDLLELLERLPLHLMACLLSQEPTRLGACQSRLSAVAASPQDDAVCSALVCGFESMKTA